MWIRWIRIRKTDKDARLYFQLLEKLCQKENESPQSLRILLHQLVSKLELPVASTSRKKHVKRQQILQLK